MDHPPADCPRGGVTAKSDSPPCEKPRHGIPGTAQPAIEARAVGQRAPSGAVLLRDVSLTISPGELVAIIGGSGAGKTTLLDTMCGLRPPATGTVRLIPGNVGYVPQDDIIHLALPLARTLRYAAALRGMPATAVEGVLRTLELAGRSAIPVGELSGGERKRASIASELLAEPALFFLDEPTSGLDPARGAELMRTLRRLADTGTTVVLTTHNPADAGRCDKVAVLAPGGRLAFFGTPEAACRHFGAAGLDEIYELIEDAPEGSAPARGLPGDSPASAPPGRDGRPETGREAKPRGPLGQWALLTRRNAEMLGRARLTLAILAGAPAMVLLMFLVLFRPGAFAPASPSPAATVQILFWVAFGGFFFGLTYGLLQICGELGVLRRERFAGVGATAYVLAKVAALLPLLAFADLLFLIVLRALGRLPSSGDYGAVFVTLLLSSAAALGLGLLISAAVSEPTQATIALPMVCFPQVLFVGAILPVPVMAAVGRWISYAMTNRWAFEALGHSLGVAGLWANGRSPLGHPLLASYGTTFDRPVAADWTVLAGFTVAFLAATVAVVVRKTTVAGRPAAAGPSSAIRSSAMPITRRPS
jgi:ABC-type multidrug transport system ATPase subunit/ABC-type multidrug transport system permease subunit